MNIFKRLDLAYKKSCLEFSKAEVNTTDYYVCKKRVELLSAVLGVLKSYSWVKREEPRTKLKYFIENRYDYDDLSKEFNISKQSAYVMISRLSKQFQEVIGVNNVDELLDSNFDIENINIKDDGVFNIFISDIREQLAVREHDDIDLLECMLELITLKNLTKSSINNRLKKLDVEKISHILYVLQTDRVEYALEKELIGAYMGGYIKSKEELEIRLKDLYAM